MTRLSAALVLLTGIGSCPVMAPAEEAAPKSAPARGRTMMFVDDHDILYRSGTLRVMNPARRHSDTALISQTRPWEVAIGWVSVYRDPETGRYQLWYQAYAGRRAGDKRLECVVCYAESDDGITFTKPDLDLFPFKDHPKSTEDGFRVRGYSRDDAVPIEGDSLRHRVAWKEHGLDTLPAGRYLLRLHLEGATLFAVSYR
jgi:hypothetical protein